MGMVVIPYSGVKETGENCPSVKFWLPCDEGSGNTLSDPLHGYTYTANEVTATDPAFVGSTIDVTWDQYGGVSRLADELIDYTSSLWPTDFSTTGISVDSSKSYLFMVSARVLSNDLCRASLGDVNGLIYPSPAGIAMSDGTVAGGNGSFHSVFGNGSGNNYRIVRTDGADLCRQEALNTEYDVVTFMKWTPGTPTLEYHSYNFDTATAKLLCQTSDLTGTYTNTVDAGVFTVNPCFRFSGYALYGVALFEFSAFPSWIDTAIWWMGNQWANAGLGGQRYFYPKLIGYV